MHRVLVCAERRACCGGVEIKETQARPDSLCSIFSSA